MKLDDFCRYDVFEITESGIRSTLVKPAGKREVVVNIKGIHPNTRDNVVLDYLSNFGKIVTTKVVHGVFREGPLKGIRNGDRSYKLELTPGENIGSYHVLDGNKVSLRYPGQQQTCGRCHEVPRNCKGRGIAKKCEAEGGVRVEFSDHILGLWRKIGYYPPNGELDAGSLANLDPEVEQVGGTFTPAKVASADPEKFAGVSIRQFPKETDQGEIMDLLTRSGLPDDKKEDVVIKTDGVVMIRNLDNTISNQLIEALHGQINFGRKLFCNGVIPLTPLKPEGSEVQNKTFDHDDNSPAVPTYSSTIFSINISN